MYFLLLWSGQVKGMNKALIPGVESKGLVGHYRDGKVWLPNAGVVRDNLPYRFLHSWDKSTCGGFMGLPQIWGDATNNDAPLVVRLLPSRGKKPMVILYFQPLDEGCEK